MATSYPTALDTLTNPTSSDTLDNPSHSDQHADLNDAVEAIETALGIDVINVKQGEELDYVERTTPASITATSEATAQTVLTGSAIAYDGSTIIVIEFSAPYIGPNPGASNFITLVLYDGAAPLGLLGSWQAPAGAVAMLTGCFVRFRTQPTAATHTYSIRAYVNAGTGTVQGGQAGSGGYVPSAMRITRV